ncbi:MAG: hypothetical protein ABIM88_05810 [candidate division WOR-3 bacterium]
MMNPFFFWIPISEVQDPMDIRNPSESYSLIDMMLTQGELEGYPLLSRDISYLELAKAGCEPAPRSAEQGLTAPVSAQFLGSDLSARLVLPLQFGFNYRNFFAYERLVLFTGHRQFEGLSPWDPRHDPRWEIASWDPQPIIGKEDIAEERHMRGYGGYIWDWGYITAGREAFRLGPSYRYAMTLSDFAGPLDFFYHMRVLLGSFKLSAGFARIPDTLDFRRLTYQRIEWSPAPSVSLALTDGVLTARGDFAKYAIPFLFFYDLQRHESDNQDNLFASGELSWRVIKGFRLYGEVFIDDPTFVSGGEAAMYAFMGGAHVSSGDWDMRAEAAGASPFTYAHFSDSNAMSALGWPMGFWLGPDARAIYLHFGWYPGTIGLRAFFELYQHGELWLDTPYEDVGGTGLSWPTGVVETATEPGLEFFLLSDKLNLKARVSWFRAADYCNQEGLTISEMRLSGFLSVVPRVFRIEF